MMYDTENQSMPICPWCGAELNLQDIHHKFGDFEIEDIFVLDELICTECDSPVEVTINFLYSTQKSDKEMSDISEDGWYNENEMSLGEE